MFCSHHPIPHEDCLDCRATVSAMRPTVFAELAAIELCAGTAECEGCGYVRLQAVARCPRCAPGRPHPGGHGRALPATRSPRSATA